MSPFILSHPLVRPLYGFLKECNESPLEKEILDCGAGGDYPPLALSYQHGYTTHGLDISDAQLELAWEFSRKNNMALNIKKGDMRDILFENSSLSFVYSINSLVHLSKKNTAVAMKEMERVLKPHGLIFVNFSSVADSSFGQGKELNKGEFLQEYDWYPGIVKEGHVCSYYEDTEPDDYFAHFEIIRKEKRTSELHIEKSRPKEWQAADLFYTAKKLDN